MITTLYSLHGRIFANKRKTDTNGLVATIRVENKIGIDKTRVKEKEKEKENKKEKEKENKIEKNKDKTAKEGKDHQHVTHVSFHSYSDHFIISTSYGHIYQFYISANRYSYLGCHKKNHEVTCLKYIENDIIIGYSSDLYVYKDNGLTELISPHKKSITSISYNGGLISTSSSDVIAMWNNNYNLIRTLNIVTNNIYNSIFINDTSFFITLLKSQLYIWTSLSEKPEVISISDDIINIIGTDKYLLDTRKDSMGLWKWAKKPYFCKTFPFAPNVSLFLNSTTACVAVGKNILILNFTDERFHKLSGDSKVLSLDINDHYLIVVLAAGIFSIFDTKTLLNKISYPFDELTENFISIPSLDDNSREYAFTYNAPAPDSRDLRLLLDEFGEYPEKYRALIWKKLLQLPNNKEEYTSYCDKALHPSFSTLSTYFPVISPRITRKLESVCSSLAYWSPLCSVMSFLPSIVYPFLKLFNDEIVTFEIILTLMTNWMKDWFEFWPNPPHALLDEYSTVLGNHFANLKHINKMHIWTLMKDLMTGVLTKTEWLVVFDHVFSKPQSFFPCVLISYISLLAPLLLSVPVEQHGSIFTRYNPINIRELVKRAFNLFDTINKNATLNELEGDYMVSLPDTHYPLYHYYPSHIVDFQLKERERLAEIDEKIKVDFGRMNSYESRIEALLKDSKTHADKQLALQQAEEEAKAINDREASIRNRKQQKNIANEFNRRMNQLDVIETTLRNTWASREQVRKLTLDQIIDSMKKANIDHETQIKNQQNAEKLATAESALYTKLLQINEENVTETMIKGMKNEALTQLREKAVRQQVEADALKIKEEERKLRQKLQFESATRLAVFTQKLSDARKIKREAEITAFRQDLESQKIEKERALRNVMEDISYSQYTAFAQSLAQHRESESHPPLNIDKAEKIRWDSRMKDLQKSVHKTSNTLKESLSLAKNREKRDDLEYQNRVDREYVENESLKKHLSDLYSTSEELNSSSFQENFIDDDHKHDFTPKPPARKLSSPKNKSVDLNEAVDKLINSQKLQEVEEMKKFEYLRATIIDSTKAEEEMQLLRHNDALEKLELERARLDSKSEAFKSHSQYTSEISEVFKSERERNKKIASQISSNLDNYQSSLLNSANGDNDALSKLSESFLASATEFEKHEEIEGFQELEMDQKALLVKSDKTLAEAQDVLRRHQFNKYDEKSEVLRNVATTFDRNYSNEFSKVTAASTYSRPYNDSTNSYYPAFTAPTPTFVNVNPGLNPSN